MTLDTSCSPSPGGHAPLHSFPTRRSSDLVGPAARSELSMVTNGDAPEGSYVAVGHQDLKSTRLNSSHSQISYAVFCSKKKSTPTSLRGRRLSCHSSAWTTRGSRC